MNKQLQIVTFEQAKKLKELGFDWRVIDFYHKDNPKLAWVAGEIDYWYWNQFPYKISAPTTALALKWLRDEKKIFMNIGQMKFNSKITFYHCDTFSSTIREDFKSYEEAESAGLDYALEYLLNNKTK